MQQSPRRLPPSLKVAFEAEKKSFEKSSTCPSSILSILTWSVTQYLHRGPPTEVLRFVFKLPEKFHFGTEIGYRVADLSDPVSLRRSFDLEGPPKIFEAEKNLLKKKNLLKNRRQKF